MIRSLLLVAAVVVATPALADRPPDRPPVGPDAEWRWRAALEDDPERLDIRWRLLRAIYYRGDFEAAGATQAQAAWSEGRALAEQGIRGLRTAGTGSAPHELARSELRTWVAGSGFRESDVARFYFWSSIHLGAWSRSAGLLSAVREGTANRLHAFLKVALELEPAYDRGAPHRMMSTLHGSLPRVPFITGWVDASRAIPEAERALAIAPDDPGNRFLWAITVLDQRGPSPEVDEILRDVARLRPRPGFESENAALREAAVERLRDIGPA